jgi:hypothetical protein
MEILANRAMGQARSRSSGAHFRSAWDKIWRLRKFLMVRGLGGSWSDPWLKAFIEDVWKFRTASSREAVVHYAPEVALEIFPEFLLPQCKDELKKLERRFGFGLGRVNIFLFADAARIAEIFGPEYGGLALSSFNAIVVGYRLNLDEDVRHELVHLFAGHWNRAAPPLLSEGLAVHLQRRWNGYPIGALVRRFGSRSEWTLRSLLKPGFFFDPTYRHACYTIAGDFTGFLIEEFGWEAYRKLYRRCRPNLVNWAFKRSFGVSLEEAETQWRQCI